MPETVFIEGGRRSGRTLAAEAAFRAALGEGKRVITGGPKLNGVWFEVDLNEVDGSIIYTALVSRPEGV